MGSRRDEELGGKAPIVDEIGRRISVEEALAEPGKVVTFDDYAAEARRLAGAVLSDAGYEADLSSGHTAQLQTEPLSRVRRAFDVLLFAEMAERCRDTPEAFALRAFELGEALADLRWMEWERLARIGEEREATRQGASEKGADANRRRGERTRALVLREAEDLRTSERPIDAAIIARRLGISSRAVRGHLEKLRKSGSLLR